MLLCEVKASTQPPLSSTSGLWCCLVGSRPQHIHWYPALVACRAILWHEGPNLVTCSQAWWLVLLSCHVSRCRQKRGRQGCTRMLLGVHPTVHFYGRPPVSQPAKTVQQLHSAPSGSLSPHAWTPHGSINLHAFVVLLCLSDTLIQGILHHVRPGRTTVRRRCSFKGVHWPCFSRSHLQLSVTLKVTQNSLTAMSCLAAGAMSCLAAAYPPDLPATP